MYKPTGSKKCANSGEKTYFCKKYKDMIQRIQTAYLITSTLLLGLLLRFPLADIMFQNEYYAFNIFGIHKGEETIFNGISLLIFLIFIMLIQVVVIFFYKKRIRQIRMLVFTMILLLGLFGLFFYFAQAAFDGAVTSYKIPVAFPLVAIILDYLAIRNIGKDEALIRSLNRIR